MATDEQPAPVSRRFPVRRKRGGLGEHTDALIRELQWRFLNDRPDAIATLAKLRRAVTEQPGAAGVHEACWLPESLLEREALSAAEPSRSERALHTSVTLWALHQQSQHVHGMHVPGTTFATAIQRLASEADNGDTVFRKFTALGTAGGYAELCHHARGVVGQLRQNGIGFDYGHLADDLRTFQEAAWTSPTGLSGSERIRATWGREYWRAKPRAEQHDSNEQKD